MSYFDKDMENLNHDAIIPVDEQYARYRFADDGGDDGSSAYSVASSAHNFRVENGRRYHDYKDGHPFPYDEVSEENEIVLHEMCLLLLDNKYFLSPIDESDLRCVADVGTGLGLWAEGVAERYPDTQVVGIDTAPQPRTTFPNLTHIMFDATDEWVLDDPNMKFDLVHIRSLFVGVKDWEALYKQCYENMNSGAWIEQMEVEIDALTDDEEILPGSQIKALCDFSKEMSRAAGRDFQISTVMKKKIEDAGFVDVQEQRLKLPLGPWPTDPKLKDVGRFYERFYKTGLQGWLLQICTRSMGWTVDQVNDACIKAFQEINSRQQHFYFPLVIVIGRKP
ncbi:Methyltransferase [Exophiala dermatitidis]